MNKRLMTLPTIGALFAAVALVGCDRQDESRTVGQKVDSVLAQADQKAGQVRDRAVEGARDVRDAAREATADAKRTADAKQAAEPASNAVGDARITTEINAQFAKDNNLSALAIDVDTEGGLVVLKGSAPNAQAKDRATQLARAVNGVTNVENQLTVQQR